MSRTARIVTVVLVIVACLALDRFAKQLAAEQLRGHPTITLAGGAVRLEYAENRGAFLSLGSNLPDGARFVMMVLVVGIALGGTLVYTLLSKDLSPVRLTSLSLMAGGGIGNLIDRIANDGRVVDFVSVGLGPVRTGIFNVADLAITTGVLVFVFTSVRRERRMSDEGVGSEVGDGAGATGAVDTAEASSSTND